jgi:thioredoxin 1
MNQTMINEIIQTGVSLIGFTAYWCEACSIQKPILDQLSHQFRGHASIVELDVDDNREFALEMGIASVPTSIVYVNGKEFERFVGLQELEVLSSTLETTLDSMD